MWFKNLQIYRLQPGWKIRINELNEQLSRGAFVKCQPSQPISRGWVAPNKTSSFVYAQAERSIDDAQMLIALKVQEKLLPAAVVAETAQEYAGQIAEQQGYAPGRKQMKEIKDRVVEELMPRAFSRSRKTFAWIDVHSGWLVIDASSQSKAEEMTEHLRNSLDEFPLKPFNTRFSPTSAMADWIAGGEAPAGFTIDRDCDLESVGEDHAKVSFKRHPLEGEQVREHLAEGKLPTKLALTWDDRVSFVLTDKLEIKRLAFLDVVKDEAEQSAETAEEQFDADFALMTGELSRLLAAITDALGGEVKDLAEQGQ